MSEITITTEFVTTGKRFMIHTVASDGRKSSYASVMSTTKTHAEAARKFAEKIMGKGAVLVKVADGPMGDTFTATGDGTPTPKTRRTRKAQAPKITEQAPESEPTEPTEG